MVEIAAFCPGQTESRHKNLLTYPGDDLSARPNRCA
jgi:hypothetical protein